MADQELWVTLMQPLTALMTLTVLTLTMALPGDAQDLGTADVPKKNKRQSLDELLLFFPSKFPAGDWHPRELRFDDVYFSAEDKTRLHGWYCPSSNPRTSYFLRTGTQGMLRREHLGCDTCRAQLECPCLPLTIGGTDAVKGRQRMDGILQDSTAARLKLRELASVKDSEMLLMGESLGGALVVQLAAASAPRGLILQSTFASLRDVADVHYPALSWLVPRNKLDSVTQIARFRGPLLQSHGHLDTTIPFASGEKLFRAANEPKWFVRIENADHNNWLTEAYLQRLDEFITRVGSAQR